MISKWDDLVCRIKQEVAYQLRNNNGAKDQGIVKITVVLLAGMDAPLVWEVEGKKIEPTQKARSLLGIDIT